MDKRRLVRNAVKALVKGVIGVLILVTISELTASLAEVLPDYDLTFSTFALIFLVFIIISQLLSGTIFKHVFNVFSALFLVWYLLYTFTASVLAINLGNIILTVNLRAILSVVIMLSLVGFAKALIELVNYIVENINAENLRV